MKAKALLLGALVSAATAFSGSAQSGTLFSGVQIDPDISFINRTTECGVQTDDRPVGFAALAFYVTQTGSYTFTAANINGEIANDNDLILGVYSPTFDPTSVGLNCITVVDDSGSFIPSLTGNLTAGTQYTMLIANYDEDESGTTDIVYTGIGSAIPGFILGGNPLATDGRLNPDPQATAVLYCDRTTQVTQVYRITGSSGTFAFQFGNNEAIAAETGDVFASGSGITVEKLADGRLLLRSPLADGKNYLFIWDGCPVSRSETYTEDFRFGSPIFAFSR